LADHFSITYLFPARGFFPPFFLLPFFERVPVHTVESEVAQALLCNQMPVGFPFSNTDVFKNDFFLVYFAPPETCLLFLSPPIDGFFCRDTEPLFSGLHGKTWSL